MHSRLRRTLRPAKVPSSPHSLTGLAVGLASRYSVCEMESPASVSFLPAPLVGDLSRSIALVDNFLESTGTAVVIEWESSSRPAVEHDICRHASTEGGEDQ